MIPHSNMASNLFKVKIFLVFFYLFGVSNVYHGNRVINYGPTVHNCNKLHQGRVGEGGGGGEKSNMIRWMYVCNNECVQSLRLGSNMIGNWVYFEK